MRTVRFGGTARIYTMYHENLNHQSCSKCGFCIDHPCHDCVCGNNSKECQQCREIELIKRGNKK